KWGLPVVMNNIYEAQHHIMNPFWLKSMVRPTGAWDFKAHPEDYPGVSPVDLHFTGNFNFGAVGNSVGFGLNLLLAQGASTGGERDPQGAPGFMKTGLG